VSKPGTRDSALAELRILSGQTIVFHTGVALLDVASGRCQREMVDVTSTFRTLTDAEIEPTSTASSPTTARAGSSRRRSASFCSSASRATIRPPSSACR
jgi:septum formation protein